MAPIASPEDIGRVVDDRYRLLAPLGLGASARVYLAEDTRLGRQVAIKMLQPALATDDKFLRRFRAEARTVAAFSHPNVVVVHDWADGEEPFLVTEYLAGGSLRAMIQAGHRLSPSQGLVIGLDVCRGLAMAHGQGLVHRDLKPANLLFDREGRLRIADFGLARAIAEAAVTEPAGAIIGTARYTAPEQAEGRNLDGKADIYALALCLIEAVTGEHPFPSDTTVGTLMARTRADLDVPREMGPLGPALARAGRLDPAERPDAEELGLALLAASERLSSPKALPLVGALTEAEQSAGGPQESTKTMTMPAAAASSASAGASSDDAGDGAPVDAVGASGASAATAAGTDTAKKRWWRRAKTDASTAAAAAPDANRGGEGAATSALTGARTDAGAAGDGAPGDGDAAAAGGRRRRWPVAAAVLVVVALIGAGAFYFVNRTPTHEVPDLVGQQIGELELLAEQYDWVIDEKPTRQNGTEAGEIVSTTPAAGTDLAEGETLEVLVSAGNELTDVPLDVAGVSFTDVEALLADAQLVAVAVEEFDEDVPADHVIDFVESPDSRLPEGTEVELRVSKGPAPRTVPPLPSGATFAEYRDALAAVQLDADRVEEFSDNVDEGVVISVGTAPGTDVARGTAIEVVVSKGPDVVEVPDLAGMTVAEATAALDDAGLELGTTNRDSGIVVVSDPSAGTTVPRGDAVDVLVRRNN